jgi:O-antigen/teichoic acid export membrane protein
MEPVQPTEGPAETPGPSHPAAVDRERAAAKRVAKNSVLLIAQPLILNVISIFATAYIARTLGPEDYGRFVFAMTFILVFVPMTNLGLRQLTVRDIAASDRKDVSEFVGKITTLRLLLAVAAALACVAAGWLSQPSPETARVVYLASAIIVVMAVTSTATDVFQAFEDMRLIAVVQFVSGFLLTVASVVVLWLGLGLVGLMASYVVGNLIGMVMALRYLYGRFARPVWSVDLRFWRDSLRRAAPLFIPNLVLNSCARLGVILLGRISGQAALGTYGVASTLTEKVSIIPDAICTALFPTLASLYARSREEAAALYRRVARYLLLLSLPIAVGTTLLARPIISLLFGSTYSGSPPVLALLSWGLFGSFFWQLQLWTVGAIHQERRAFFVPIGGSVVFLGLALLLIPRYGEIGLCLAGLVFAVVTFVWYDRIMRAHLSRRLLDPGVLVRAVAAAAAMAAVVWLVRGWSVLLSIPIGAVVYAVALLAVGGLTREEASQVLHKVGAKLGIRPRAAAE